jgi:hypothetical protein
VTDDSDRTSLRSDLERNRFVTFVMESHEASERQVRDGMRSNPAMPVSLTAEVLRSSSRRETDRARALTSRTSRQRDSNSVSSVLTSASAARTASVTPESLRSTCAMIDSGAAWKHRVECARLPETLQRADLVKAHREPAAVTAVSEMSSSLQRRTVPQGGHACDEVAVHTRLSVVNVTMHSSPAMPASVTLVPSKMSSRSAVQ